MLISNGADINHVDEVSETREGVVTESLTLHMYMYLQCICTV